MNSTKLKDVFKVRKLLEKSLKRQDFNHSIRNRKADYEMRYFSTFLSDGVENMSVHRWEDIEVRTNRFLAQHSAYLKSQLGENFCVSRMYSDLIDLIGFLAVPENTKIGNMFGRQVTGELVKKYPDLTVKVNPSSVLTLEVENDGVDPNMVTATMLPHEVPVTIQFGSFKCIVIKTITEYPDRGQDINIMVCTSQGQKLEPFRDFISTIQSITKAVKRKSRSIDVYEEDPIPLPPVSWSTWDDVFLSPEVEEVIRGDLEFFLKNEPLFRKVGLPYKRGYLLAGVPGCGKTSCVRAMATSMPFASFMFDFSHPNLNNGSLTDAFKIARAAAPSLFILEDIDRVFDPDSKRAANVTLDHLLNQLDGIAVNDGMVIVATANNPKNIDPAILQRPGRFDKVVNIGVPDSKLRKRYLNHLFRFVPNPPDLTNAIEATEGVSMAFLKELFVVAAHKGMTSDGIQITQQVLDAAVKQVMGQYSGISKTSNRKAGF